MWVNKMDTQVINNLFYQAEKLSVEERLLLIERLAASIRRVRTIPQVSPETLEAKSISKWAKLVQQVKENPIDLGDYTIQLKRDMQDFRETFTFKHDNI
jgi:hypothetical protein